ncbi:tryptophan halogenase family protein [Alteraurantiacibacter aquimixticola]|uniref:Tryptophan 7-halogenase n=1 Tax=Alteraurantiacibacter aquimixticola TaxID=2489173 RepID=A0A4T3F1A6_9SPHN|nr:tryptophan halogenase family protein [Alteraurantiacibacter aquimixticola]TIX50963.1 tryptophan 7-halogenase [Alteraurantiacibacter aquimixticola]
MTGETQPKLRVVVLGGGTAGWMTAAGLVRMLPGLCTVALIESQDIGIVGVGEATLPHIRGFVERLGIDEAAFMKATHATYKLGIDFRDFGRVGESYIHPFGTFGEDVGGIGFHHYWLELQRQGLAAELGTYSLAVAACRANRFAPPSEDSSLGSTYGYAYQFDATLFGPFMREFGTANGVTRHEGLVTEVERDPESGDVTALILKDGRRIEGELFVDCSGFRSLLLGQELEEAWDDWTHWLPCDRAAAMPCTHRTSDIRPYTIATAMPAGWRWQIPLQHRMGNGYVFSSAHIGEDEACEAIRNSAEGDPLADPRILKFRPGRRTKSWSHNVIGVGLASGFLEPLESTSIYLAQMAITYLIELFPTDGRIDPRDRDEFNRLVDMEYDRVRDFLILHYNATTRDDSDFWNHVRTMQVPDTLADKLELWKRTGRIEKYSEGLFYDVSWMAVYLGQGLLPEAHDSRVSLPDPQRVAGAMERLQREIDAHVAAMPGHVDYLTREAARLAQAA